MTEGISSAPSSLEVRDISVASIFASPTNPRKFIDKAQLEELAQSIRAVGIQVPLSLRETGKGFEIVGGERRWRAAQLADQKTVPAIVREMSDEECREAQLIENLQREDLAALDEADAYAGLLESLGSVQAIAAKSGKSIEHVTRVLKLRMLIPFSRQALGGKLITVDHALLLAKLADAEQEKALRFALRPGATRKDRTADILAAAQKDIGSNDDPGKGGWHRHYWQPQTVLNLKSFIEREIKLELKRAPWDLKDAELLPSAGACTSCPKNTAANAALFGDLAITDSLCTDAACFNAKRDAFVQVQLKTVAEAGKDAVRISWKFTSSKPRALDDANSEKYLRQVFKAGQWIAAKKGSCGFIRTGVTVDFEESAYGSVDAKKKPGMKLLVCVAAACKAHKKEWEKPAQQHVDRNGNSPENRAKAEKIAELAKVENAIRADLVKRAIPGVKKLSGELLRKLLLLAFPGYLSAEEKEMFPGLGKALTTLKVDSPEFARAAACLLFVAGGSGHFVSEWRSPENGRAEFIAIMKLLGIPDAAKAWDKKPEPKSSPTPFPKAPAKSASKASPARKAGKKSAKKAKR